jgi:cytochrome c-type biogenesis protein CcmH/NrfF
LRWVAPAVVAVVTTLITVRVLRRHRYTNLFAAFFLFTAVNSVLQMMLYLLF